MLEVHAHVKNKAALKWGRQASLAFAAGLLSALAFACGGEVGVPHSSPTAEVAALKPTQTTTSASILSPAGTTSPETTLSPRSTDMPSAELTTTPPTAPDLSAMPPRLAESLQGKLDYEVLTGDGATYDVEWYPWTQVLTVKIYEPAKRAAVEQAVRDFFQEFGVNDLNILRLSWCENHPENVELGKPRWQCSRTFGE